MSIVHNQLAVSVCFYRVYVHEGYYCLLETQTTQFRKQRYRAPATLTCSFSLIGAPSCDSSLIAKALHFTDSSIVESDRDLHNTADWISTLSALFLCFVRDNIGKLTPLHKTIDLHLVRRCC